jgi:hypothetical protein
MKFYNFDQEYLRAEKYRAYGVFVTALLILSVILNIVVLMHC